MDTELFWKRVRDLLKAHKISLADFAKRLNIPLSTFYSWLQYKRSVEVGTAYCIASSLGVSVEYLVTGKSRKSTELRMGQIKERKSAAVTIKKLFVELQKEMEILISSSPSKQSMKIR